MTPFFGRGLAPALVFLFLAVPVKSPAQDAVIATSDRFGVLDHLVLKDAARDRTIALTVYYPVGQGHWPFPVIVFSQPDFCNPFGRRCHYSFCQ